MGCSQHKEWWLVKQFEMGKVMVTGSYKTLGKILTYNNEVSVNLEL